MIARKSALIVGMNVVGAVFGFATLKLIAIYMNVGIYGQVGFALGILNIFSIVTGLGFDAAHVKRVSEGRALRRCIGTFVAIKGGLTAIMVVLYVGGLAFWTGVLGHAFVSTSVGTLAIVLVYGVLYGLRAIPAATFDGLQQTAKTQVMALAEHLMRLAATAVVCFLFAAEFAGTGPLAGTNITDWPVLRTVADRPAEWLALTLALAIGMSAVTGFVLLSHIHAARRPDRELAKSYLTFAVPMFAISVIGVISENVDKVALGFFWDDIQVGYYFALQRIHQLIMIVPVAVGTLLFPAFSGMNSAGSHDTIRGIFRTSVRYISMVVLPPVVLTVVFPEAIIHIALSDAWLPAADVLRVLALYAFVLALVVPHLNLVQGLNRPSLAAKVGLVMALGNIGLNLIFIPDSLFGVPMFGLRALGAALATLLSALAGLLILVYVAHRLVGARPDHHVVLHLIAAIVMAGVLVALNVSVVGIERWFHLVGFGAAGLIVYLAILALLREFDRTDLRFFLGLMHPGEMTRYVVGELSRKPRPRDDEEKPL